MRTDRVACIVEHCRHTLDLDKATVPENYGYNSLVLCIIDAIFSMGVRYQSTRNTVHRFIEYFDVQQDMSITNFIDLHKQYTIEFMTTQVYQNRQRTSPTNGILKAEAVLQVAQILQTHGIELLDDLASMVNRSQFEANYKAIHGQSSGISLRYFYMLAGDKTQLKPDRMILRFMQNALNTRVSITEANQLLTKASDVLKHDFPQLTTRDLDNAIWKYQRSQR